MEITETFRRLAEQMIVAERDRQRTVEGWTAQHDRTHFAGELVAAGLIYLHWDTPYRAPVARNGAPVSWPWSPAWWKPKDKVRNLVRAGALFVAENDRALDNAEGYFGPDNWKPHLREKYRLAVDRLAAAVSSLLFPGDDWRCVNCKRVVHSTSEPERCVDCWCCTFAKLDPPERPAPASPLRPIPCAYCLRAPVVTRTATQFLIGHDPNDAAAVTCPFHPVVLPSWGEHEVDAVTAWNDVMGRVPAR